VRPVVWVTSEASPQPRSGGTIRTQRLLAALASATPVDLVVIGDEVDADALAAATGAASVRWFPTLRAPVNRPVAARHGWPVPTARCWHPAAVRLVRGLQAGRLTVVEHSALAPYRPLLGPYVFHLQNAEAARLASLPAPAGRWRRVERRWDIARMRRLERAAAGDPRARTVVVSEIDAALVGAGAATVIANGTDLPANPPPPPPGADPLFVGSLDYPPNRDGLAWFAEAVWPLLGPDRRPVTVVGRGGPAALGSLARHPALRVVGEVPDVGPHLAGAGCVVVPLHAGSGSRLKVLEALAWARPVVSTTKGVEGIPDAEGVLLADRPVDFAAALTRLRADPGLAGALGSGGRRVAERYAWPSLAARFVGVCAELPGG